MKIVLERRFWFRNMGESMEEMCGMFNSSKKNIERNNNDIELFPGEWVRINVNDFITHVVKPMEKIEDIAKNYSVSAEKIVRDNALSGEKLFIGQRIKIYEKTHDNREF